MGTVQSAWPAPVQARVRALREAGWPNVTVLVVSGDELEVVCTDTWSRHVETLTRGEDW